MSRPASQKAKRAKPHTMFPHWLIEVAPWLLTVLAVVCAKAVSETDLFKRLSLVVSDTISEATHMKPVAVVEMVRIAGPFNRENFQTLLSRSIQTLIEDYHVAAVGVDIDFTRGDYATLAESLEKWQSANETDAKKVVWAVGLRNDVSEQGSETTTVDDAACEKCSDLSCRTRFTALPVFNNRLSNLNYGISISFPGIDGSNRSSVRFVCPASSESHLETFHFKLVRLYCASHSEDLTTCRDMQVEKQATTPIHTWYDRESLDLCKLVDCEGSLPGAVTNPRPDLHDKIVLLYSDTPGDDEALVLRKTRKGAQIVATLIENELEYGVVSPKSVEWLERALEAIFTISLFLLFHWKTTKHWAIIPALLIFVLYVHFLPALSRWVPDFTNYALAIIVSFWIEVLIKSSWGNIIAGLRS